MLSLLKAHWAVALLVFVPLAVVLEHVAHASGLVVFLASAAAIVPLAAIMGRATERLAVRFGEGIGGLLNATFGNAAELIIGIVALRAGHVDLVKASITGSIVGNLLLVFGAGALYGGLRYETQKFNQTAASIGATMLVLSVISLVVPAIFHHVAYSSDGSSVRELSFEIAIVLIVTYALSLVFTLRTHRYLYSAVSHEDAAAEASHGSGWQPLLHLLLATAGIALMSEMLVGAVEEAASGFGMSELFVGVILVALVGNAAEHSSAVLMAGKNRMDVAINIAVGSSTQIVLFVAPVLVFLSYFIAPRPMDLLFTSFEVVAVALSVGIMAFICNDGESNWLEGVQLLAVYVILALGFFFLPQ